VKPGKSGATASQMASAGQRMGVFIKLQRRPRLGASKVPRQLSAPHQQG